MGFGYRELLVILLICLLVFGGKKIPEIARGLGKGLREFKKARDDIRDAIEDEGPETDMADTTPQATEGKHAEDPAKAGPQTDC